MDCKYRISMSIMINKKDEILQCEDSEKINEIKDKNQELLDNYLLENDIKYDAFSFMWQSDYGDCDNYGELFSCDIVSDIRINKNQLKAIVEQMDYFSFLKIDDVDKDKTIFELVERDGKIIEN